MDSSKRSLVSAAMALALTACTAGAPIPPGPRADERVLAVVRTDGTPEEVTAVDGAPRWLLNAVFSPDGRHVAWAGRDARQKMLAVRDGIAGQPYDLVTDLRFSPDSRTLAYTAYTNGSDGGIWELVLERPDGRTTHPMTAPSYGDFRFAFLPDGGVAYLAAKEDNAAVARDGEEGPVFEEFLDVSLDEAGTVYALGRRGETAVLTINDKERGTYPARRNPEDSSSDFSYATFANVSAASGAVLTLYARGNSLPHEELLWERTGKRISLDGRDWPTDPDTGRYDPWAKETRDETKEETFLEELPDGDDVLVHRGTRGKPYYWIREFSLTPDGTPVLVVEHEEGGYAVVIGDREGLRYDQIHHPVIAQDNTTVGYGALRGNDVLWVTVPLAE